MLQNWKKATKKLCQKLALGPNSKHCTPFPSRRKHPTKRRRKVQNHVRTSALTDSKDLFLCVCLRHLKHIRTATCAHGPPAPSFSVRAAVVSWAANAHPTRLVFIRVSSEKNTKK